MFKVIVEVKQPTGHTREGIGKANGKPYKMAEQEAAIFVTGADYPIVGMMDIYVPKVSSGFGEPEWKKPGRYTANVRIQPDRFRRFETIIDFRTMQPIATAAKAA